MVAPRCMYIPASLDKRDTWVLEASEDAKNRIIYSPWPSVQRGPRRRKTASIPDRRLQGTDVITGVWKWSTEVYIVHTNARDQGACGGQMGMPGLCCVNDDGYSKNIRRGMLGIIPLPNVCTATTRKKKCGMQQA